MKSRTAELDAKRDNERMASPLTRPKARKRLQRIGFHLLILGSILFLAAPVLYAIIGSTFTTAEASRWPPKLMPGDSFWENLSNAWDLGIGRMLLNSFFVSSAVVIGKTIISVLAGFAFVYFNFRGKSVLFALILVTLMFPIQVRIVALFDLAQQLELGDTYTILILPFIASATGTFLFRQHFRSIPSSLVEAARIDGAGPLRFLFQILIPMSWNAIGALAVVMFVYAWNQYLWPLIIMSSNEKQVVQVGLRMALQSTSGEVDWGMSMAAVLLSIVPPLIVFFLLQKPFMRGFDIGEEK